MDLKSPEYRAFVKRQRRWAQIVIWSLVAFGAWQTPIPEVLALLVLFFPLLMPFVFVMMFGAIALVALWIEEWWT